MNILITSANSAQAHRLKNKIGKDHVMLGDYHELPAFMLEQGKMKKLPNPRSFSYTHEMLDLCLDNAIEVLYVLDIKEAELLMRSDQLFAEYGIKIEIITNEV